LITDNNEIYYKKTHIEASVQTVSSKVYETYKDNLNPPDHHPEKATSAGYNNNYLEKKKILIEVLNCKRVIRQGSNDLGELPSNSHSKFQGHHLPKDDQRDLVNWTDQVQPEHF